ncbi:MAG: GNAT family N-acetyltransferase [Chitinophagaceae bacterium]|nr:GNAT family N-acetyltransferase [Chitinophagaceae bacterium]
MKKTLSSSLELDTDSHRLPIDEIFTYLQTTYWAANRSRDTVRRSIQHSLCFGLYLHDRLIGFARVVTDFAVFAYLCDVYIVPDQQGKGYGKMLMQEIAEYPELQEIRRCMLATKDAHGLYAQYGYSTLEKPDRWMEKFRADL